MTELRAPLQAQIVEWLVRPGDRVNAGDVVLIVEAMKMEHELRAPAAATVRELLFAAGAAVHQGDLLWVAQAEATTSGAQPDERTVPIPPSAAGAIRPDLRQVLDRHAATLDAARPEAMARRHALGLRSARENIAQLCDARSFIEYGALAIAAQRSRRTEDDLVRNTPATRCTWAVPSTPTPPTRQRASCSCATPTACRW